MDLSPRQTQLLERVLAALEASPAPLTATEIARNLFVPPQSAEAALSWGVGQRKILEMGSSRYLSATRLEEMVRALRDKFGTSPFEPRDLREALSLSRTEGEAIMKHLLDSDRLTKDEHGLRLAK